jgi:hypothetical protein
MSSAASSLSVSDPAADAHRLGRWFAAARREGLLALLPPEVWHTLSAILSFTTREGRRAFTVDQLGLALGLSRDQAQVRLDQLEASQWRDEPLAVLERDREGEIIGATLAPIEVLAGAKAPVAPEPLLPFPGFTPGPEAVVPDDLASALAAVGLNPEQIAWLMRSFPQERLRRQLDWLPQRQARNPAALLLKAIEGDWGPPREAT